MVTNELPKIEAPPGRSARYYAVLNLVSWRASMLAADAGDFVHRMQRAMMKCVILAGGKGTRISEETIQRPKPMIEIGGRPILWHIMKI